MGMRAHAAMVRVRGRDSHLQRSTATPVSLPIDGFTTLGSSGLVCRTTSGRVIVLAPASIFNAFLQSSDALTNPSSANAAKRVQTIQQFGTRLEIHKRPLSAAQSAQAAEQQPVEYKNGQQLQDKVTVEVLLDDTVDQRSTAAEDLQREADWRACKLLGWAHITALSGILSRLLQHNVWYVGWSEGKWGGNAEALAVLQVEDTAALSLPVMTVRPPEESVSMGEAIALVSSPYGILAPFAFLNSVSHGHIANIVYATTESTSSSLPAAAAPPPISTPLSASLMPQPSTASEPLSIPSLSRPSLSRPSLLLTDTHILPGSEGCPALDSSKRILGMMAPPLRKWGTSGYVGGEVNVLLPIHLVLRAASQVTGEEFQVHSAGGALPIHAAASNWASGVLISKSIVLTNAHLFRRWTEGSNVKVPVEARIGNEWVRLDVIYVAAHEDIALLEIPQAKLTPDLVPVKVRFTPPEEGERVAVVGYPQFGPVYEVDANVTVGVVGRVVRVGGKAVCVCVSADVAAGNSGGLLIDSEGAMLGLVTNNVKDRLGKIIPKLNMSIPAERLKEALSFAESRDLSLLRVYDQDWPEASRVWKLQLAQRAPPRSEKVMSFLKKIEGGNLPMAAKL